MCWSVSNDSAPVRPRDSAYPLHGITPDRIERRGEAQVPDRKASDGWVGGLHVSTLLAVRLSSSERRSQAVSPPPVERPILSSRDSLITTISGSTHHIGWSCAVVYAEGYGQCYSESHCGRSGLPCAQKLIYDQLCASYRYIRARSASCRPPGRARAGLVVRWSAGEVDAS
jgi:hypothetical protein